jgi:hypothetical protein
MQVVLEDVHVRSMEVDEEGVALVDVQQEVAVEVVEVDEFL